MPQGFCSSDDPKYQLNQVNNIEQAKQTLLKAGYSIIDPPYLGLMRAGRMSLASFGFKVPKPIVLLLKLVGLSPGIIKLWFDTENGWLTEARLKPGAPPVYKSVEEDIALIILKKELTHELEDYLMTPAIDIDN